MSRQDQIEHFVSSEPFDPASIEALTPAQEKYYLASQWMLMWTAMVHWGPVTWMTPAW